MLHIIYIYIYKCSCGVGIIVPIPILWIFNLTIWDLICGCLLGPYILDIPNHAIHNPPPTYYSKKCVSSSFPTTLLTLSTNHYMLTPPLRHSNKEKITRHHIESLEEPSHTFPLTLSYL